MPMVPLAYLDQNVLGYVRDGTFSIGAREDVVWVYSNEHFREISRGHDTSLLTALQDLRARQIEIAYGDQWQMADQAVVQEYASPFESYEGYLETVGGVPFDETLFTGLFSRLVGADNLPDILGLPQRVQAQLERLLTFEGSTAYTISGKRTLDAQLTQLIGHLSERRSLESLRKPLGIDRGRVGNVASNNPIPDIWGLIKEKCAGLSIDQFLGFESLNQEQRPKFLGIVACHAILNVVGYRTDRHIARPEAIAGIMSDGNHIAHAAFCDLLVSGDRRMCDKASAIYSYMALQTVVAQL